MALTPQEVHRAQNPNIFDQCERYTNIIDDMLIHSYKEGQHVTVNCSGQDASLVEIIIMDYRRSGWEVHHVSDSLGDRLIIRKMPVGDAE